MARKRKGQRPQPAGWEKAMKRVLKPEHVERLNDNQIRVTFPPCPDFDIEEDETVEVWIPPAVLVNADKPIYAGSFTIKADSYEERIDHAIKGLKEEQSGLGPQAAVASFLLTFCTCEIVAKSVVSHSKYHGQGRKSLAKKWTTKDVSRALDDLMIDFDGDAVDALFSTGHSLASEMSARELRDNLVHRMKRQHRDAIRERYTDLLETMTRFLSAVGAWRDRSRCEGAADGETT